MTVDSEMLIQTKGRKSGLPREVMVWFVYDESQRKFVMLTHRSEQWWRNVAWNEDLLYKIENEMNYHSGYARVCETDHSNKVHAALDLFKKKYGQETVNKWYSHGQDRVVVELKDVS